ncbi:MAG: DUF1772 domain-containing protein [Candidatus Eremiobacteraeota bacterium]|nr:DUF1772 domain-containing protein [Candidatus Eremiobacteraeota bacterium]
MTEMWGIVMLVSGALFISGLFPIAWERAPAWRAANEAAFRAEFAHTLRRVDRLQPALLLICLVSSIGFAISVSGTPRILAGVAAVCIVAVLVGSGVRQVPIQRRLADLRLDLSTTDVQRPRASWLGGHMVRTVITLLAFVLLVIAALACAA